MNFQEYDVPKILLEHGFKVIETSVRDKNQTRFMHLVVTKNNKKYFGKVNKVDEVYELHGNSALGRYFSKGPAGVHFMIPLEVIRDGDLLVHIYDYLDLPAVSNESEKFQDFNVKPEDIDTYFTFMIAAIDFVAEQKVITMNDSSYANTFEQDLLKLIRKVSPDIPHGLELIKYLLREGNILQKKTLAVYDTQPQNTFWVPATKELYLFDLEHLGPNYKYYDFARFSSYLWFIYNKSEYAKHFLKLALADKDLGIRNEKYSYIKFNLIWILMDDSANFKKDEPIRNRILEMLAWIRSDLLDFANDLARTQ